MQYIITFFEGIITFISPCLLPMLPIYVSYFANGENNKKKTLRNALGFIVGFTLVFVCLGAFAGTVGSLLTRHKTAVNIITGLVVVIFGLHFSGILKFSLLNRTKKLDLNIQNTGFFSSLLFGIVFSIGWTPCVGAFLGSALLLASERGSTVQGIIMLVVYSIGLGIPFILSAVLIDRLKTTFNFIKKHYSIINKLSGLFLILIGILMMTGTMGYFLSILSR